MSSVNKKELRIKLYDSDSDEDNDQVFASNDKTKPSIVVSRPQSSLMKATSHSTKKASSDESDHESKKRKEEQRKSSLQITYSRNDEEDDDDDNVDSKQRHLNGRDVAKSPPKKKIDHFSRPLSRQKSLHSSSENSDSDIDGKNKKSIFDKPSDSTSKTSKSMKKKSNKSSSRSNSSSPRIFDEPQSKSQKKASQNQSRESSTNRVLNRRSLSRSSSSSSSSSTSSNHSSRSSRSSKTSKQKTKSRKHSSGSSTETEKRNKKLYDDDDDEDAKPQKGIYSPSSSTPIKVNVGHKPPIDKSNWNKKHNRSSSLEKPYEEDYDDDRSNSNSDTDRDEKSRRKPKSSQKTAHVLNRTFDLDESDKNDTDTNEMTDVSPLPTPKHKSSSKSKRESNVPSSSSFDMKVFYKELDKQDSKRQDGSSNRLGSAASSTVRYLDEESNFKSNNSYANKLMRLDAENRRLYKKLIESQTKSNKATNQMPVRLTSSALNRQKEQQRIERENQLILKRLLKVKPSKCLCKEEQLKDYERNVSFNLVNCSRGPSRMSSSQSNIGILDRSALSTKRSTKSSANDSRVSSAKHHSRNEMRHEDHFIHSGIRAQNDPSELLRRAASASRKRPEWNDRW